MSVGGWKSSIAEAIIRHQIADLVGLAAQADQDIRADVGVTRHACQRALQQLIIRAADLVGAAGQVRQSAITPSTLAKAARFSVVK